MHLLLMAATSLSFRQPEIKLNFPDFPWGISASNLRFPLLVLLRFVLLRVVRRGRCVEGLGSVTDAFQNSPAIALA